jgi:hypothetical protein
MEIISQLTTNLVPLYLAQHLEDEELNTCKGLLKR